MNPKGNIWLAIGTSDTGKTHTVMEMAYGFSERSRIPKSIIVFDHTNNSSYHKYNLRPLSLHDLYYIRPEHLVRGIVQSDDIDEFCRIVTMYIERCIIIFDDCGVHFRGNLTTDRESLLKTRKNNGTELIFQTHTFREIAPSLLDQTNMFILKETVDDPEDLPSKVTAKREIGYLLIEIIRENLRREEDQKWATRIYDPHSYKVWIQNPDTTKFKIVSGNDYFPFSAKKRYAL